MARRACGWAGITCLVLAALIALGPGCAGAACGQSDTGWPEVVLTPWVSGLQSPVHITHAGDGSGRLFVVEQPGRIRIVAGAPCSVRLCWTSGIAWAVVARGAC